MKVLWKHRSGKVLICSVLFVFSFGATGCDLELTDDHSLFLASRELVMEGRFAEAKKGFVEYLSAQPTGKFASRASFFVAKCDLGLGDLPAARIAFENCRELYPNTNEAEKSSYKLAFIDLLEGNENRALEILRDLAANPRGTLSPEAAALAGFLESKAGDQ
ncbi:MAG: hypothetical protein AAGJ81_14175 [Verrucomicrobiota bacterium]